MYRITVDYFLFLHNSQYDQDANDQRREFMCIFDIFRPPLSLIVFVLSCDIVRMICNRSKLAHRISPMQWLA